jgi:hypothetical protein
MRGAICQTFPGGKRRNEETNKRHHRLWRVAVGNRHRDSRGAAAPVAIADYGARIGCASSGANSRRRASAGSVAAIAGTTGHGASTLSGIMPPTPAVERPHPDPFETIRPTKENIRTMIGRHFWTGPSFEGYRFMRYCPPKGTESCLNYPSPSKVEDNTGFTVAGVSEPPTGAYAYLADDQIYVKVRLDDGRTGYGRLDDAFWYTQDPQLRKQAVHERVTRALADCQRRPSIAIGMTEPEVLASKWGNRSGENSAPTSLRPCRAVSPS